MSRRRLLLIASLPLVVAVIVGVLAILPPRPGVTEANLARIKIGMGEQDVVAILGRHPDAAAPILRGSAWFWMNEAKENEIVAEVQVDLDFNVMKSEWKANQSETVIDKIRRWLHLD
jgi:hypothetical protein